jgi:hypothetical protein
MQRWQRCIVAPKIFADVVGSGKGTLCGKTESSNAIVEGMEDILLVAVRSV